jgi:hypothetical protein
VRDHKLNITTCLSREEVVKAKRETEYITFEKEHTKKQAMAKEHVEVFFKLNLLLSLSLSLAIVGVTLLSLCFDLAMMNML